MNSREGCKPKQTGSWVHVGRGRRFSPRVSKRFICSCIPMMSGLPCGPRCSKYKPRIKTAVQHTSQPKLLHPQHNFIGYARPDLLRPSKLPTMIPMKNSMTSTCIYYHVGVEEQEEDRFVWDAPVVYEVMLTQAVLGIRWVVMRIYGVTVSETLRRCRKPRIDVSHDFPVGCGWINPCGPPLLHPFNVTSVNLLRSWIHHVSLVTVVGSSRFRYEI